MERRFPYFLEVMQELPPGLKGWEEMYPSWYIPREEMAEYENSRLWYQDKIHGAHPRPPLESTIDEAWGFQFGASANRIYCIPPAQGLHHRYLGTYFYVCGEAVRGKDTSQRGSVNCSSSERWALSMTA